MKYAEINKRYTEIVSEYITAGYTMNTATMTGSQGEIASIDLTNGNEILRVLVTRFTDWSELCTLEGVEIIVGQAGNEDRLKPHDDSGWHTIWNNHLEVLRQERFYQVGESRRSGKFYGNLEEAEAAGALRLSRYRAKHSDENKPLPAQAIEVAKRVIRERLGVKRICKDDVKISRGERGGYTVSYRNSACRIHQNKKAPGPPNEKGKPGALFQVVLSLLQVTSKLGLGINRNIGAKNALRGIT